MIVSLILGCCQHCPKVIACQLRVPHPPAALSLPFCAGHARLGRGMKSTEVDRARLCCWCAQAAKAGKVPMTSGLSLFMSSSGSAAIPVMSISTEEGVSWWLPTRFHASVRPVTCPQCTVGLRTSVDNPSTPQQQHLLVNVVFLQGQLPHDI